MSVIKRQRDSARGTYTRTMSTLRINPNVADVVCSVTGKSVGPEPFRGPVALCECCPSPGRPMIVRYALDRVSWRLDDLAQRSSKGLWAHGPLLPVEGVPDGYAEDVGLTPSMPCRALGDPLGVDLWIKNEGINPTGSFKDRGLAVAVALAKATGASRLCLPTQGNAGVAAAFFSQRLGLEACSVTMPEAYEGGLYHRAAVQFGASVAFFGANIAAAGKQMRLQFADELASGELIDVSTFFEPGRLEGKKTLGLEIAAHFGADGLPDVILYPTGGGTGLVGIWKALSELTQLGCIDRDVHRLPRLFAVQSEQCAPVVASFDRELEQVEPIESRGTIADGLDVPAAIMGHAILRAIRESGGGAVAVAEDRIRAAFVRLGRHGINAGYEAAATLAGLESLRESGSVPEAARVLLLNTGSHLIPLAGSIR